MRPLFFCNIGWMKRYKGLKGRDDDLIGGGRYPDETGHGGEVCNFARCEDGFVYGHVESIKGENDRKIVLKRLGGGRGAGWVTGVDVVWTATHPTERGRRVVGWYKDATIFHERVEWQGRLPSQQHRADGLWSYRIVTRAGNEKLLKAKERDQLRLGHGPGWLGQTQWWIPSEPHVMPFVRKLRRAMGGQAASARGTSPAGRRSASSSNKTVTKYMQKCEIKIPPRHTKLQKRFHEFCQDQGYSSISPDEECVDLRYRDDQGRLVFAEIKPCEKATARIAIRTAMGQLLDYSQERRPDRRLIVIDTKPDKRDLDLARTNKFGLAFQASGRTNKFIVVWP